MGIFGSTAGWVASRIMTSGQQRRDSRGRFAPGTSGSTPPEPMDDAHIARAREANFRSKVSNVGPQTVEQIFSAYREWGSYDSFVEMKQVPDEPFPAGEVDRRVQSGDTDDLVALASDPRLSRDEARKVFEGSRSVRVRRALAGHGNTPKDVQLDLANSSDRETLTALASSRNLYTDTAMALVKKKDSELNGLLAANTTVPEDLRARIVRLENP